MDNILVAAEPTEEGRHVWQVASRVASEQGAQSRMLNVVEPAVAVYADLNFTPLAETSADWQKELVRANKQYLADVTRCAKQVSVIEGYPAQEISKAAEEGDADLVVMGIHNRRGLRRLLGSTTHNVLNATDKDLLAVHPDSDLASYKRLVIAVDTTDLLSTVLAKAKTFAKGAEAVNIVSVLVPLTTVFAAPEAGRGLDWSFSELAEDIKKETRTKIEKAVDAAHFDKASVELRFGDPRDEIVAAAEEHNADLIVIGSNNRGAINRFLLGSTARGVLNHTPCDVLVCRAH